jgi:hypothetical protein
MDIKSGSPEKVVLFGVESSFAPDVIETLIRLSISVELAVITGQPEWDLSGLEMRIVEQTDALDCSLPCIVPWMTPGWRKQRLIAARGKGFTVFPNLIDPTAVVPTTLSMGSGCYINAGVVIGAQCLLSDNVFLNRASSIGHHCKLADYTSVGPGATLASNVRTGPGVFVGAGAAIAPYVNIGTNTLIASGASVYKDVPGHVMIAGNPSRIVKTGIPGHKGIGV